MDGLFLGLTGGMIVSMAIIMGPILFFFKNDYKNETLFNFQLDFFVGILLLITAGNIFPHSMTEKIFFLSLFVFILGLSFMMISKKIVVRILEANAIYNSGEQVTFIFLLTTIFKSMPIGLAAGAAMNLNQASVGYSLLTAIGIHYLFTGFSLAMLFRSIDLDLFWSIVATMIISIFILVFSLFGGYLTKATINVLPLILVFASGAVMSGMIEQGVLMAKKELNKFVLLPKLVSMIVVMLIFIVCKELL